MYAYKYHCTEMRKQKNLPILSKTTSTFLDNKTKSVLFPICF